MASTYVPSVIDTATLQTHLDRSLAFTITHVMSSAILDCRLQGRSLHCLLSLFRR